MKKLLFPLFVISSSAYAQQTITSVAKGMQDDANAFYLLIGAISFLSGIGFFVATYLKLKQFKDNPQQTPIGTPITLLFIAIILTYLPSLILPAGQTLFGEEASKSRSTRTVLESV